MTITGISDLMGNGLILLFLVGIPVYAFFRKVPVYDVFVEGAKEGFPTFLRIAPFMIAMLVAVGMLRASGAFELLNQVLAPMLGKIGIPPEIAPIAIMRPFSATAAMGMVADLLHTHGGNDYLSHMAIIVASTTESTFYIVAIYFGAASITKNRHVIPASVIVDIVGILSAVWITCWLLKP
ncbi:MAG: nucleoside recognition domain-containing protein [Pseudomonadota bacterium]